MKCPTVPPLHSYAAHRSTDERDLADRSGFEDLLVCARSFGEWQFLANDGAQSAVFEACKEPGVFRVWYECQSNVSIQLAMACPISCGESSWT